jgi:hypothetical protein
MKKIFLKCVLKSNFTYIFCLRVSILSKKSKLLHPNAYCSTEIIQAIEGVVFLSLFLHTSTSDKKSFNTERERIGYVT